MNKETANNIRQDLTADCSKCFGLCCTALNIIASSDFPINKPAATPCMNLQSDYSCQIHSQLREKGFKGCTVYDCLGAGQIVSQVTFNGQSWRDNPETGEKMFQVFPIMEQIHEMIAYAAEAMSYDISNDLSDELGQKLKELQDLTKLGADELLSLDLVIYRFSLNELLTVASDSIRENIIAKLIGANKVKDFDHARADWIGKKLKDKDLRATDFRGAYLIAADMRNADLRAVNFIGADLRDADISGADLSTSMFLTQMQINSAKGDVKTKLPSYIQLPSHWSN
ncbi:pentapeptide repeat-containing protein [Oceanobacillus piezotolerans]|uniref:Pentapeptide repeat-containing protein n=1 Tax=Oceanobacillus piezotolerans TaxID=2448030 RepID=A0A498DBF9_9BACI|nr:pentapeptide repeat-containing protein [Oceanobacillus piezotolerans]RLL48464.1 pentapeptide repeat-containing protein [Oceanobacillus piezotolerans]